VTAAPEYLASIDEVPGWFFPPDTLLFVAIDDMQTSRGITGDLLEIGVFQGRCAILMGCLARPGERLVVCDLFEDMAGIDEENKAERLYNSELHELPVPARADFERCYLRYHESLPEIHQRPSSELDQVLPAGSFRIVHVDGGHTYNVAKRDLETARHLLGPGGIVIFDDWSNSQAPGIALAIWEEYLKGELIPLCFTPMKFYATWDPSGLTADEINAWAARQPDIVPTFAQQLLGREACHFNMSGDFWSRHSLG